MKTYTFFTFSPKMRLSNQVLLFSLIFFGLFPAVLSGFNCPQDITISCCTDYTNTEITGHPATFNQGFSNYSFSDEVHLNECREGYIIRTWKAWVGTTPHFCEQIITMEYMSGFGGSIQWPPDWSGNCSDDIPFLEPQYDRGFCDMVAHTYNDDTLRYAGQVCMKILREWKVIDWCKYRPNSGNNLGIWKHTQVLMIVDGSKPEISLCSEWNIPANNSDCTADAQFYKSAIDLSCDYYSGLKWRIEFDRNNDWSVDSIVDMKGDSVVFGIQGLEPGEHKITWKVADPCGNVKQCMELIHVSDGKAPTPFCYLSMPLVLMPQGNMLAVDANHFIKDGRDNCSDKEDIRYAWSPDPDDTVKVFDCDDTGFQFLPVYAIDETGNFDFCFVFTRVLDHGNCSGGGNLVQGSITTFSGLPVSDIQIALGNNPLMIFSVDTTTHQGKFSFRYIETIAEPDMYFRNTGAAYNGITTLDLVVLWKYLIGLQTPENLVDFLSGADVNGDGTVNVTDLVLMRDVILGLPETMDSIPAFRIYREDPVLPGTYKEIESVKDFTGGELHVKAVRVGDIDRYFR